MEEGTEGGGRARWRDREGNEGRREREGGNGTIIRYLTL